MPQNHSYTYHICWAWYNGSYTMATKPIKFLELHYTMTQFLIIQSIPLESVVQLEYSTSMSNTPYPIPHL